MTRNKRPTRRLRLAPEGRYDRQELAGWSQQRLSQAKVLVIGAGAIGNEVVKGLALVGVGCVMVVDMDHVAPSNLTRCVLFRDSDVGRPKADVVCERAAELNPDSRFIPVVGDLEWSLSDDDFHRADVVLGCLDNAYARYVVNRRVRRVQTVWIDGGISVDAVQVSHFSPDGPCWACGLGDRTIAELRARFSCTGFRRIDPAATVPTTAVTASVAGALLLQSAISVLHGRAAHLGSRQTLLLSTQRLMSDALSLRGDCPFHVASTGRPRRGVPYVAGTTLESLVDRVGGVRPASLRLEREITSELKCGECGVAREYHGVLAGLPQELAVCESCGAMTTPVTSRKVRTGTPGARQPLTGMGIRPGDWLDLSVASRRRRVVLGEGRFGA